MHLAFHAICYDPVLPLNSRSIRHLVLSRKSFVEDYYKTLKGEGALEDEVAESQSLMVVLLLAERTSLVKVMQLHCYFLPSPFLLIAEVAQPD